MNGFGSGGYGSSNGAVISLQLQLNDEDVTGILHEDSFRIVDALNGRNTFDFELTDFTKTRAVREGFSVYAQWRGNLIFAGTVDEVSESLPDADGVKFINCRCVDFNQIAGRFLVNKIYTGQSLRQIVLNILGTNGALDNATRMWEEGILPGQIDEGPVITKAVFPYKTVASCFDDLSRITGMVWNIDYNKRLNFFAVGTYQAPFSIGDSNKAYRDLERRRERSNSDYRNRQFLRAGVDRTEAKVNKFVGDGTRTEFTLDYAIAELNPVPVSPTTPTLAIRRAGLPQQVGIRGKDPDGDKATTQWYYQVGENSISQNPDSAHHAPLADGEEFQVAYYGQFPIVLVAQSTNEIAARRTLEGGTGVYEDIEEDETIDGRDLASERADALLQVYSKVPNLISFELDTPNAASSASLAAGQVMTVTLASHALSGAAMVLTRISYRLLPPAANGLLRVRVDGKDGNAPGGFADFYRDLFESTKKFVIRENESIMVINKTEETVQITDSVSTAAALQDPYNDDYTVAIIPASSTYDAAHAFSFVVGTNVLPFQTTIGGSTVNNFPRIRGSKISA